MNELLFLTQIAFVVLCTVVASRWSLTAITAWVTIQGVVANLFVLKQITLFQFHVTASDAFAVGGLLGLNLLQERFGKEEAQRVTWISFFHLAFFAVAAQLHLLYLPSPHDSTQEAFSLLLSPSLRLLLASIFAFFFAQRSGILFSDLLKNHFSHISFALRSAFVVSVSLLVDTLLFTFSGLSGIASSLQDIIILSLTVKLCVLLLSTPMIRLAR